MNSLPKRSVFQLGRLEIDDFAISLLVAVLYIFSEIVVSFSWSKSIETLVFTSNYILLVAFINYWLVPRYFHQGKYLVFFILAFLVIILSGIIEEGLVEPIFYPDSRGAEGATIRSIRFVVSELFPIAAGFFCFKIIWDYRTEQNRMDRLARENVENELKFLKSQINPHVLFNNLNNIYSYSLDRSSKVPDMILKLSNTMRYMLYECDEAYVPLAKEIEYLDNYIELQKIQLEDRGEVDFRLIGNPAGYRIAPLLLIAFVENCFKHSMATQIKGIKIKIEIRIIEGLFDFRAENNFAPTKDLEKKEGGVGLSNVMKRLELLYKDKYELNVQEADTNYWVNLRLQLI